MAAFLLKPATKLHNIYRAINTFSTKQIKLRDWAINQSANDNQKTREAVQESIPNPSSLLSLPPVTLRDFLDGQSGPQVRHKGCNPHKGCNAAVIPFERQIRKNLDILPLPRIKCKPF
jgi:hypothetical protein